MTTPATDKKPGKRYPLVHHGGLGMNPDGTQLYASIPMTLARDPRLSPMARSTALYLWSHVGDWQTSAVAIAEALGVTRKAVGAGLDNLQEHGWLVRQPYARPGKKPSWERWHVQRSNTPFPADEIRELSQLVTLDSDTETTSQNDPRSEIPCVESTHGGESISPMVVSQNDPGGCVKMTHQRSRSLVVDPPEVDPLAVGVTEVTWRVTDATDSEEISDDVIADAVEKEEAARRSAAEVIENAARKAADPWSVNPTDQWSTERVATDASSTSIEKVTLAVVHPPQPWDGMPDLSIVA